jgi:hypothetical protein
MRSIVFVALGLALLAALFVAFRPDGAPSLESLRGPTASAPAVVPVPTPTPAPPEAPAVAPPESPGDLERRPVLDPVTQTFDLGVTRGRLTSGPSTLALTQGDLVVLRVRSDRDDELHVHGYDLALPLAANQTTSLAFQADRSGRFDIELHKGGGEIGALEVQPR